MMTIIQLVAAFAACVAVFYAYRGVEISAASRKESLAAAHAEALARAESEERALALRRLDQIETIASQIIHLREVAQSSVEPANRPKDETDLKLAASRVPILQSRLRISLEVLANLAGPELAAATEIVEHPFHWGTQSHLWIAGKSVDAIAEIGRSVGHDPILVAGPTAAQ